jgi:hypothetical protein
MTAADAMEGMAAIDLVKAIREILNEGIPF